MIRHALRVRPIAGQRVSGDAAVCLEREKSVLVAIVDGLGHGPSAHAAASAAESFLGEAGEQDVVALMQGLDQRLRGTVGAVAGLGLIEKATGLLHYVGVGNTAVRRFGVDETRLVSQGGVIGERMRTPRPQSLVLQDGDLLVLHTDGVSERFGREELRSLGSGDVERIASELIERFGKAHDDASCLVARYQA